jgi:phage terminase small subunit
VRLSGTNQLPGDNEREHCSGCTCDPLTDAMEKLTPRQRRFCVEYIKDLNGSAAAIRAGYARKGARVEASKFLANPNIQYCVRALYNRDMNSRIASAQRILEELSLLATSDVAQLWNENGTLKNPTQLPSHVSRAVKSVKVKQKQTSNLDDSIESIIEIAMYDKVASAAHLAKYHGLLVDRFRLLDQDPDEVLADALGITIEEIQAMDDEQERQQDTQDTQQIENGGFEDASVIEKELPE